MRGIAPVALLALLLFGGNAAAVAPPNAVSGFSPSELAGTWTGTWKNQTFNTSGTLALKIGGGKDLVFTATIGGKTFGCTPPAPQTLAVPAGLGATGWNAKGFRIALGSKAFGTLNVLYGYPFGMIHASGTAPACAPGLSWKFSGRFAGRAFTGTASIKLPDGSAATTVVALTKS